MSRDNIQSLFELLPEQETEAQGAILRTRKALANYDNPINRAVQLDNPRRERVNFPDGSSLDVNVHEADMYSPWANACRAELGREAIKGFWKMMFGPKQVVPEEFTEGLAVHIRTSYDGGWTEFAITDSTIPAEALPQTPNRYFLKPDGIFLSGTHRYIREKLDISYTPNFKSILEELGVSADQFLAISVGIPEQMMLQVNITKITGELAMQKISVERLQPID